MRTYHITILEPESPAGKGLYGIGWYNTEDPADHAAAGVRMGLLDALYWLASMEGFTLTGKLEP